jgi:hypothetical protein
MAHDRDLVSLQEIVIETICAACGYAVMEFVHLIECVRQRFHGI